MARSASLELVARSAELLAAMARSLAELFGYLHGMSITF